MTAVGAFHEDAFVGHSLGLELPAAPWRCPWSWGGAGATGGLSCCERRTAESSGMNQGFALVLIIWGADNNTASRKRIDCPFTECVGCIRSGLPMAAQLMKLADRSGLIRSYGIPAARVGAQRMQAARWDQVSWKQTISALYLSKREAKFPCFTVARKPFVFQLIIRINK